MALAALRGDKTLTEIAQQYEVHPNQVTEWKRQLLERAADVFDGGAATGEKEAVPNLKELHAKIGQQALEIDFLSVALTKAGLLPCRRLLDACKVTGTASWRAAAIHSIPASSKELTTPSRSSSAGLTGIAMKNTSS